MARSIEGLRTLNLGKAGITEAFVSEARTFLKKYRRVRVRALKSALDGDTTGRLAGELESKTGAVLVDVRGHTFTLASR